MKKCLKCPIKFTNFEKCRRTNSILWIGLSHKPGDLHPSPALKEDTTSGKIIKSVEERILGFTFYKTNLVKCAPIGTNGKLRYPSKSEMENCYPFLKSQIESLNPSHIILLGSQVTKFIISKETKSEITISSRFEYKTVFTSGLSFIPIHHPSYIAIYKRKKIEEYIQGINNALQFA